MVVSPLLKRGPRPFFWSAVAMKKHSVIDRRVKPRAWVLAACGALVLCACGGGESLSTSAPESQVATSTTTLTMNMATLPEVAASQLAQPFFHSAPGLLSEPDDADSIHPDASAHRSPHRHHLADDLADVSTRQLTVQDMQQPHRLRARRNPGMALDAAATPMAASTVVATYSPAQIRAAYGLPALPVLGTALTSSQAAQLGAGQTIYIVDAQHDPNAAAELAAFNQKFGLPTCTTKAIASTAALPLPPASGSACEFSVVFNTAAGAMTPTAPAYDAGWATEITLDVQWAHATAPLARIVLIEAADATLNSLLGAVKLANAMGPGIVSMSFGANEGNWTASVDSVFTAPGMSYLAATGDSGAAVSWPSVSSNVVAVGGTTLSYTGTGARSEIAWTGTGGGVSAYTATPSYQTPAVPGLGSLGRRAVADVAFNADPASGQYVAVQTPGTSTVSWLSVGGTSLSTPQWAGLMAVANASRAQVGKPALGAPHAVLYGQISTVPGTYYSAFADITRGTDGTCALCTAKTGYDPLTGLGTPNVTGLLSALVGTGTAAAPVVTPAAISGVVGTPLSFTAAVTAPSPVTYTLSGAPAGMAIASTGVVSWATPVLGTYAVTVTAKDSKTALSGQGVYTVTIAQQAAPVVTAASVSGTAGVAFSYATSVKASNPVTYTLSGAPAGLTIGSTGVLAWASPVAGSYKVTVVAKDSKTALTGQGVITLAISAPLPPSVSSATVLGKPAVALSFTVAATAPNPMTFTLSGAPTGMVVSNAGVVSWASPVLGTYNVTVVARDSKTGLTGQGVYTIKIATAGPVITAAAMKGVAGKPMSGSISITDATATSMSISISGVPLGMGFSMSGTTITAVWANPVTGNYNLKVVATDNLGLTAQVTIPVTITAK
jgi:subtilase family serine protease